MALATRNHCRLHACTSSALHVHQDDCRIRDLQHEPDLHACTCQQAPPPNDGRLLIPSSCT
eukprot:2742923-Lingulodinium_polyedra.AAC.1